jgi:predicted regulator of Ras-like GTPase activity (Roadblock/LC7/MglB family)
MGKLESLQKSVDGLRTAIPELKGVLVASTEGLPIAHSLSNGADAARVAAMAAAACSLGRRVSVASSDGKIFLYSAGTKGVLAVIGPHACNAGLVHLEARGVAKDLSDLLQ